MAPRQDASNPRQRSFPSCDSDSMERGCSEGTIDDSDVDDSTCHDDGIYQYSSTTTNNKKHHFIRRSPLLPPTQSLPLLVFIDMFAVSLVVPLLFQYYINAGVTSANQRELLSSVFSSSQIVGGLILGGLTDAHLLRRKTILFLSFSGSAVAYALMVYGGFHALIASRVLVGLVKQTMTVTTSMLTRCTTEENRAKYMGR